MSIVVAVGVTWLALIAAVVTGWHRLMQDNEQPRMIPTARPGTQPHLPLQRGVAPDTRRTQRF